MLNSNEIDSLNDARIHVLADGTLQIDRTEMRDQGKSAAYMFIFLKEANDVNLKFYVAFISSQEFTNAWRETQWENQNRERHA